MNKQPSEQHLSVRVRNQGQHLFQDQQHPPECAAPGMAKTDLPFIDEHCIQIAAPREQTWVALGEVLSRGFGGIGTAKIAAVLGTQHKSVSGTPLAVGSSIVGFRVTQSQPERRVVLEGEHRFSRYRLTFDLHDRELCATTHAEFPGFRGTAYKAVLLGARGHVLALRRLLGLIKSRAEGTAE